VQLWMDMANCTFSHPAATVTSSFRLRNVSSNSRGALSTVRWTSTRVCWTPTAPPARHSLPPETPQAARPSRTACVIQATPIVLSCCKTAVRASPVRKTRTKLRAALRRAQPARNTRTPTERTGRPASATLGHNQCWWTAGKWSDAVRCPPAVL
jgi:hypothetical protein